MRVITFICFAVVAIVASPAPTRNDPITAVMNFLTRQVPFQRIPRGEPAPVKAAPYGVSFQVYTKGELYHFCGGSILSPTKILTAGHCGYLMASNPKIWKVAAGKTNLWTTEDSEQYATIASVAIHPEYRDGVQFKHTEYDVAIIEVSTPFKFNEFVKPIELVKSEPTNGDCIMSGWEFQSATYYPSPPISRTIPVVPRDTCAKNYMNRVSITSLDICAGDIGMGPCFGTGRPLVCNGALAGVASWPSLQFCGASGLPVVFANVAQVQGWIKTQL